MNYFVFLTKQAAEIKNLFQDAHDEMISILNKIDIKWEDINHDFKGECSDFLKINKKKIVLIICLLSLLVIFPMIFVWLAGSLFVAYQIITIGKSLNNERLLKAMKAFLDQEIDKLISIAIKQQQLIIIPIVLNDKVVEKEVIILRKTEEGLIAKDPITKMVFQYPWYRIDLKKFYHDSVHSTKEVM